MKTKVVTLAAAALAAVAMVWSTVATAQEPELIGEYRDWRAYKFTDAGGKICYIVSEPKKDEGNYNQRGDIYFLITHRPSGKVFNEVSMIVGYEIANGFEPTVTVNGNRSAYRFYADGDAAWVFEDQQEGLVGAMKRGSRMVVKSKSNRGTATTDTYSLSGVTASLRAIDKECKR